MKAIYILLPFILSACHSNGNLFQGQRGLSSQVTTTTLSPGTNSQGLLLNCNQFEQSSLALKGRVMTYTDPMSGYQDDRVNVRLNNIPTNWDIRSNLQIRFYRWRINPNDDVTQDPDPLEFYIRDPKSSRNVSAAISYLNNTVFFSILDRNDARALLKYNLVVMVGGLDEGYHVIRPVLYNSQLNETVGYADALIPAFVADPNLYAKTHHTIISELHPFWNIRNEGWVENNYIAFGKKYCF